MSTAEWIALGALGVTILLALIGAAIAMTRAAWNLRDWLAIEFTATRKTFFDAMASHEALDQRRHDDNLGRFSDIRAALARAGLTNGQDHSADHH